VNAGRALLLALLPLLAAVLVVGITWGVRRNQSLEIDERRHPGLTALRRSTVRARYAGAALAVAAFALTAGLGRLGWGLFLAPSVAALVLVAAIALGQQVTPADAHPADAARPAIPGRPADPADPADPARPGRGRVGDYLPRGLLALVAGTLVAVAAVAGWTTVTAGPDADGLARAFTAACTVTTWTEESGAVVDTTERRATPFPGWFYTSALALGLPPLLAAGGVTVWRTVRRPRHGPDALVRVDAALRRQTIEGTVAAGGTGAALSLMGVAWGAALPVGTMSDCADAHARAAWGLAALGLAALVVALKCAVLVLAPGDGTRT